MALYTAENLLLSVPSLFTFSRHILRHTIVPPLDIEMSVIIMSYVLIFFIPGYKYLAVQNPILSSLQHFRIILSYWVFWVQAFYLVQSSRPSMVQTSPGARSRTWSCWRNGIKGNQNRNRFRYCHCATCDLKVLIVWIVLCMQNADRKIEVHKTQTDSNTSTQYLKWKIALTH